MSNVVLSNAPVPKVGGTIASTVISVNPLHE